MPLSSLFIIIIIIIISLSRSLSLSSSAPFSLKDKDPNVVSGGDDAFARLYGVVEADTNAAF